MFELHLQSACDIFLWVGDFRRKAGKDGRLKLSAKPIQTQALKQTQNRKEYVNFLYFKQSKAFLKKSILAADNELFWLLLSF